MRSDTVGLAFGILILYGCVAAKATPSALEKRLPLLSSYTFEDCYTDGAGEVRVLPNASGRSPRMTLEKCAAACETFAYFGVFNGVDCFCGEALRMDPPSIPESSIAICNIPCPSDPSQKCGGSGSLSVWRKKMIMSLCHYLILHIAVLDALVLPIIRFSLAI